MRKKHFIFVILSLFLTGGTVLFLTKNSVSVNQVESLPIRVSSRISPNGLYRGDFYRGNYSNKDRYYELFVTNLADGERRKIFSGDPRTSGWEWTKDNKIKITYNCGTGCRATKIIGTNETINISDYKNGGMNKENGWEIKLQRPAKARTVLE